MERSPVPAPDNEICSGAGILPYTIRNGEVFFLFHQTHIGKKVGTLIDFGGAVDAKDAADPMRAACREFIEETFACTMDKKPLEELKSIALGLTSEQAMQQSAFVQQHIQQLYETFKLQYDSTEARTSHSIQPRDSASWPLALRSEVCGPWNGIFDRYYMFFCFVEWKPASEMTELFEFLSSQGEKGNSASIKKRTFEWISSDHLLQDGAQPPLFSRVAGIHNLKGFVHRVLAAKPQT